MNDGVNLTAILLVNIVGLLIIFVMSLSNIDTLKRNNFENRVILTLIFTTTFGCILDMLCFTFDGNPGKFAYIMVYVGNLLVYASNLVLPPFWTMLVENHLTGTVSKNHIRTGLIISLVGAMVLIVNFFIPWVFTVDSGNVYSRGPLAFIFALIEAYYIVYCLYVYFTVKAHGGMFKFFPVVQFIVPAITGVVIQQFFYGVSTIWTCMAVALCGVLFALQNERIYKDSLTGLYNRAYLDHVKREAMRKKTSVPITLFFLDLDDFKGINDNYGHKEGDKALKTVAAILRESAGSFGSVIRFAGDEFIIALNYQNEAKSEKLKAIIEARFDYYNATSGKPYKLQASIGIGSINLDERSIDELFEYVDKKMYEEKRKKHKVE